MRRHLAFITALLLLAAPAAVRAQEPDCDRQRIESECRQELDELIRVCSTLQDWMVVSTIGADAEPRITCASADCSAAIRANETRRGDPFTSIVKALDKQCDASAPVICQLECYGWSP